MSSQTRAQLVEILLVEDNPDDVELTLQAFKQGKIWNHVSVTRDGAEALEFLNREGKYSNSPRPSLIMLDLHLPKKDGREVLAKIKQDPNLKRIPVVVLTNSKAEEDILKMYDLHANCYIAKPVNLEQFIKVVRSAGEFWLEFVEMPPR